MANKMPIEEWRDVPCYEGIYQVSNFGRVKSVARISAQGHRLKERMRKPETDKDGYSVVNLCANGSVKVFKVHRLVAMAFIPNDGDLPQVNHINGIKDDNRVINLEWVTGSENVQHAFDSGIRTPQHISFYGERNPHCKLTDEQCDKMRSMKNEGTPNVVLSKLFGVGPSQVGRIVRNQQRTKGSVQLGY